MTDAEIERGKGQMRGGIVLGLEDSGSRMSRIGKSELVYGDIIGVTNCRRVDAVTPADVAAVVADLLHPPALPDRCRAVRRARLRRLRVKGYDDE